MYLEERKQDIFTMPSEYYLAHCISADFALGAGIAKEFSNRYSVKEKLLVNFSDKRFKLQSVGTCILIDKVFNLITKQRCYSKPTYENVKFALEDMKKICKTKEIKKIAMPKIGCGLDRLEWNKVKQIILDTFEDTDIEIVICIKE